MKKASEIISTLFKEHFGDEFMENAKLTSGLFSSWAQLVAEVWQIPFNEELPAIVSHSRIRELERGVLLIEADHPGWIQILQTKQEELLFAVQRKFPELEIRAITIKLSVQRQPGKIK